MSTRRDMSGTLGRNLRREKDTHPTHSGRCMIGGRQYWISAWVKEGADGSKFFSLAFKPAEERHQTKDLPAARSEDDFDDDIPF